MSDVTFDTQGVKVGETFLSWESLDAMRNQFRFENSVLVKISFQYGRVTFVEDQEIYGREEWAKIKENLTGLTAWYSDFAGKHSETSVTFWDNVDVQEITDLEAITAFHDRHGMSHNDLDIVSSAIDQCIENGELDDDGNRIPSDEE